MTTADAAQAIEQLVIRDRDGDDIAGQVAALASSALSPEQVTAAWDEVMRWTGKRDGLLDGSVHWTEVFGDDFAGTDPTERAIDQAAAYADEAIRGLVTGDPNCIPLAG
jgi:hypothetical protein